MDRNRLINLYNGTSTLDEKTGDIETYENWLERQLISREHKLNKLPIHGVIPSLFKERRLSLNQSMQDVTDQTDISKATISRIERGNDAFFDTVMILHNYYADNGA